MSNSRHIVMRKSMTVLAALASSGCILTTAPDDDVGFIKASDLQTFAGCYSNCSDTSDGSVSACLSSIIWPDAFEPQNRPDAIYVRPEGNAKLTVSAISGSGVIKKSTFTEGEHFYFRDGQIELKREYEGSSASPSGNVFLGLATAKTTIGIDAKGDGRVSQASTLAGTAFLVIPVAGSMTDVSRIERSTSLCTAIQTPDG